MKVKFSVLGDPRGSEVWEIIPEANGIYQVSSKGNVRNALTGKTLKPYLTGKGSGYSTVQILGKNKKVHRLVAAAFIPNPAKKPQVNHIDGNKENNAADNLEWVSNKENVIHAHENGLAANGDKVTCSKLTKSEVKQIRQLYSKGDKDFGGKPLARIFGVSDVTIRRIVAGKKWRHIENES